MKQRMIAWLVLAIGLVFARGGYLENVVYNIDEAEYAVAAQALPHGWMPGADLLGSTKPPGIVLLYHVLFQGFGTSLAVVHIAHLLLMILGGIFLIELARSLWGDKAGLPAALLYWMVTCSFDIPPETIALNVESPGMVFTVLALWLAWSYQHRTVAVIGSGIALGLAVLFRQSFVLFVIPMALAIWMSGRGRFGRLAGMALGALLPWIPVVIWYAARGDFLWAWDSWVRYPLSYAGDSGLNGFLLGGYLNGSRFLIQTVVPTTLSVMGIVRLWRQSKDQRMIFVVSLYVVSILAVCSGSRFFGHYFIQAFPAIALAAVPAWLMLRESVRHRRSLYPVAGLGLLMAALHFPTWSWWDSYATGPGESFYRLGRSEPEKAIAAFAREHTRPGETITVWGYCPQIYFYADRLPGTRDYLCHYTTGFSPGTFDPQTEQAVRPFGHPRAQQMFIEDLEKRQPKYIFDLVQIRDYCFTFYNYSLRQYPDLADYVRVHYLPDGEIENAMIYRRRTAEDKWWPIPEEVE
jgi:4-amino-4-deoxy-L-arabinose transferase-like glycosyltransferase